MSGWGKKLAQIWSNNVAPSRPSIYELSVYTQYLRTMQNKSTEQIKLLVLGSTPEFRDWGFEQNLSITVVDKSINYYYEISRELRHKNIKETVVISQWEDMHFEQTFDFILGDLAIGNVAPERFDEFIERITDALTPGGIFMGKSFLWDKNTPIKTPEEIISDYEKVKYLHPYTFMNHQLGLYCLDRNNCLIDFSRMYNEVERLFDESKITEELFSMFQNVGWNTEMKFSFYAPQKSHFIECVNKRLKFVDFVYTEDVYTDVFPIFVVTK